MPTFGNLDRIRVTAQFVNEDGTACAGDVFFSLPKTLGGINDPGANVITVPTTIHCHLDSNGFLIGPDNVAGVLLIATDDPDVTPNGFTWHAKEVFPNRAPADPTREYDFPVPYNSPGGTLDLADVAPIAPVDPNASYATEGEVQALRDLVAELANEISSGPGTGAPIDNPLFTTSLRLNGTGADATARVIGVRDGLPAAGDPLAPFAIGDLLFDISDMTWKACATPGDPGVWKFDGQAALTFIGGGLQGQIDSLAPPISSHPALVAIAPSGSNMLWDFTGLIAAATPMTVAPSQSAAYTANPGELVPIQAGTAFDVTLPTAPPDATRVTVRRVSGTNDGCRVVCGGTDVFEFTGGATNKTLVRDHHWFACYYRASNHVWVTTEGWASADA